MKINLSIILAFLYRMLYKKIDYNKVVFSSTNNNSYDYNSRYLFEYMQKNTELNCLYVMNDKQRKAQLIKEYGKCFIDTKTFHGAVEAFSAGSWIMSAGLPVYIPFAAKRRFILNVGHGMPFKKSGLNSVEVNKYNKMFYKLIFSNNYSGVSCTSKFFGNIITDNFKIEKDKALCLGQARNDQLYNNNDRQFILEKFFHTGNRVNKESKLLLYAPTFRDEGYTEFFPFHDFDLGSLNEFLSENDTYIFLRPHKHEQNDVNRFCGKNIYILDNNKIEDIMELLNIFDVLITDYSSIFLDYLILERPIIFIPYDLEVYSRTRGFVYDYDEYTPGEKPDSMEDFIKVLQGINAGEDAFADQRRDINALFNEVTKDSCKLHTNTILKELHRLKNQ